MLSDASALSPFTDFIAGTIAGVAALVVGHPFDTVKVRFQNANTAARYSSTFHALLTILRDEGVAAIFEGISSPLYTCALLNGLIFAAYGFFTRLQLASPDPVPTLVQVALAGAGTGFVTALLTTPVELVKIQQQTLCAATAPTAGADAVPPAHAVVVDIWRHRGLRGMYQGLAATMLREFGYTAYFFAYEAIARLLTPVLSSAGPGLEPTWLALFIAGGVAGVAGWTATFPFDVIKTRAQSIPATSSATGLYAILPTYASTTISPPESPPLLPIQGSEKRASTWDIALQSYREEGIQVFFHGYGPTLIRAFPVNAANFLIYEAVKHVLL